jgi:hypothetical protein
MESFTIASSLYFSRESIIAALCQIMMDNTKPIHALDEKIKKPSTAHQLGRLLFWICLDKSLFGGRLPLMIIADNAIKADYQYDV